MENIIYTVIPDVGILRCIDTSNGMTVGSINIDGQIKSGPIITGDRCTVVISDHTGTHGKVYKLPIFSVVTTFSA